MVVGGRRVNSRNHELVVSWMKQECVKGGTVDVGVLLCKVKEVG